MYGFEHTFLARFVMFYPTVDTRPPAESIRTVLISLLEMNSVANLRCGKLAIRQNIAVAKVPNQRFSIACLILHIVSVLLVWKHQEKQYAISVTRQSRLFSFFCKDCRPHGSENWQLD